MPKKGTGPLAAVLGDDDLTLTRKGHCWTPGSVCRVQRKRLFCVSS